MKKFFVGIINVVIIMFFISCGNTSKPVINKAVTDNSINFEFQDLNETIYGTLDLDIGDSIKTTIDIKSGTISTKVEGDNKEIPYEGNDVKSGEFSFEVAKKGTYTFTLVGKKATGNISFKKNVPDNNKDTKDSKDLDLKDNKENTEKVIVEGIAEEIEVEHKKSNLGYTISYDKNRFKYSNGEGSDTFMAPNADANMFPNVFLAVSKISNQSIDEIINGLILQSGQEGVPKETTIGKENYKAKKFTFREGSKYNSRVCEYYVTEKNNEVYLIEINYFVEAEEGYGARLHGMLDTFALN